MKKYRFFLSVVFAIFLLTETLHAADTIKINLTYKHRLTNTGNTSGYITIQQRFYTWGGTFFREINYDDKTGQVSDYIFRFFKNDRLFTEECHKANDSLAYIIRHTYDQNNNETEIVKLVPGLKQLIPAEKTVMVYDNNHKIVNSRKYVGKKTGITTKYKYDASGLILTEASTFKSAANAGKKQEIKTYSHLNNRIDGISVIGKDLSGKSYSFQEKYTYNEKGLLTSIKRTDAAGNQIEEKVYKYLPSGAPSIYEEHDASGKLIQLLQYDYKKHYMDKGTQVSEYENF